MADYLFTELLLNIYTAHKASAQKQALACSHGTWHSLFKAAGIPFHLLKGLVSHFNLNSLHGVWIDWTVVGVAEI